ncbi:MAG: dTDP-4-dehydrorhamnose reductase [Actinobacteria bacterium]|nr:dTDP-4-dehydrorhamnose reductase [Actinomycetota bacterium]
MKVFLIGVDGQLGTDIEKCFTAKGIEVHGLIGLKEIDICDYDDSFIKITSSGPDLVINTAAFHNVDLCEDEVEQTFKVNVGGVKNIAGICREMGIPLMNFSTDYVFDGSKDTPYFEDDCPGPLSIYAISRLGGERVVQYMLDKYYLIRLSGLYGHAGCTGKGNMNFIETMLKFAESKREIKVVDDQILTPTSTVDVAEKLAELIMTGKYGLYHMTNTGSCSWYEFACEIFKLMDIKVDVIPVSTGEFGARAIRPGYSVLDNVNLRKAGIRDMDEWKKALRHYLEERK